MRRARSVRRARGWLVLIALGSMIQGVASEAHAALITYAFTGTVVTEQIGTYFPGKNVGDPYSGTFTLDTSATPIYVNPTYANYVGAFSVTVEAITYPVIALTVWSGGPTPGPSDGIELSLSLGSDDGWLSLRSSLDIFSAPVVPTSLNLADMNVLAQMRFGTDPPFYDYDVGNIQTLELVAPEPGTALLVGAGLVALAGRRRRRCQP